MTNQAPLHPDLIEGNPRASHEHTYVNGDQRIEALVNTDGCVHLTEETFDYIVTALGYVCQAVPA